MQTKIKTYFFNFKQQNENYVTKRLLNCVTKS